MSTAGWVGCVIVIALLGAGIVALLRLSARVSNNSDDKES